MTSVSIKSWIVLLGAAVLFLSYSANPPQGSTGAPGEGTCASAICHSGNNLLINGHLEILGIPDLAEAGNTYSLILRMTQTSAPPQRGGFQMTVLDDSEDPFGIFSNQGPNSTISTFNGRSYFEHQPARNFDEDGMIEYSVDWTTPESPDTRQAIFYVAANFTNGNASNSGDRIITLVDTINFIFSDTLSIRADVLEFGCVTGDSSTIELTVDGGLAPYSFIWNDGTTSPSINTTSPGIYSVTVTDQTGDSASVETLIDEKILPNLNVVDTLILYPDENGLMAELTPEQLVDPPEPACIERFDFFLSRTMIECSDPGLAPLLMTVTDSIADTTVFTIVVEIRDTFPPETICVQNEISISTCDPFSYPTPLANDNCAINDIRLIEGLGPNKSFPEGINYEVYRATDIHGNTAICTITIINTLLIDLDLDILHVSCNGDNDGAIVAEISGSNPPYIVGISEEFLPPEQLSPGAYELFVRDDSGCTFKRTVVIEEPEPLVISGIDIRNATNVNSGDGKITVTVEGGSLPYSFRWFTEDELFSTEENLDLLFPGIYILDVEDANSCKVQSDSLIIETITAVNDPAQAHLIQVFPNPFSNEIFLKSNKSEVRIEHLDVYNLQGQLIMKDLYTSDDRIQMGYLPKGVYILKLRFNQNDVITKKLVKLD